MLKHVSNARALTHCGFCAPGKINRLGGALLNPLRRYATAPASLSTALKPGSKINGFTVQRMKDVPELNLTALRLGHDKTGAEYLHIARDDMNNVFSINFKTNPVDDTGLPHILEHVTLCGSEKYPVRDPFFKMMPRSLANFMNAFTSSDFTSYPFATTNKQDFANLSSVYLDATLHPLLKHSDFLQEGWRLGPENPQVAATRENIQFKGVVYNEMKGQMSDASYLFYVRFRDNIFPAIHNSGGDPEKITDLTHEQLVAFSKEKYHPSNSKLYSYGDLDLGDHLGMVDNTLSKFEKRSSSTEQKMPRDLSNGPVEIAVTGPVDSMQSPDRQSKASITWLTGKTSDLVETFSVSLLSSLLMTGYGSPFYQGLIESGLGSNFSPNSGYDASGRVGMFSIGLDGMKDGNVPRLKDAVDEILRGDLSDSFSQHKVEGHLHQLEIALKHKTPAFGISLLERLLPGWFNGVDPLESLAWNEIINSFKGKLSEGNYLQQLVEKYFHNNSFLLFTMKPDPTFSTNNDNMEADRKKKVLTQLENQAESPEEVLKTLEKQELDLLHEQETLKESNIETLPSLRIEDVARSKEKKSVQRVFIDKSECMIRETATNGITYFQAKNLFEYLPDELRLLLPLFSESLMRLGTKTKSVGDLEVDILRKTGGISISPFTRANPWSLEKYSEGLLFDGYALDKNVPAMLDLLRTLILGIDFSSEKALASIQELLESKTSGALDSVAESGNHFAIATAAAGFSPRARIQEQLSGLTQIEFTSRLLSDARADPDSLQTVIDKLKLIQTFAISNSPLLSIRLVNEPYSTSINQKLLHSFLRNLPAPSPIPHSAPTSPPSTPNQTFVRLPFPVSYTAHLLPTVPYTHPYSAPLTILAHLLTHTHLHPSVRESSGAYGCSATLSPLSGLFASSSYRDPNPRRTLTVFRDAGRFAHEREWSARELEEGKLSVFQQLDAPEGPGSEGLAEFMAGVSPEMEQRRRERLLDVSRAEVQEVAHRFLVERKGGDGAACVLGEKKAWVDEDGWSVRELKVGMEQ